MEVTDIGDMVFIDDNDAVWLAKRVRWWDLATVLWWWLTPSDKKAKIKLTLRNGSTVNVHTVRVATKHARVRSWQK